MLDAKQQKKAKKSFADAKSHFAHVFEALGDPMRLSIFQMLAAKQDLCVTDVANICGISVPAASYQLKILEMVGLVNRERMGKMICYKLRREDSFVKNILKIVQ